MSLQIQELTPLLNPEPSVKFPLKRVTFNALAFLGFSTVGVLTYQKESNIKSALPYLAGSTYSLANLACDVLSFYKERTIQPLSPPAHSDRELKKTLSEIKDALAHLNAQKSASFNWTPLTLNHPFSSLILEIRAQIERLAKLGRVEMGEILSLLDKGPSSSQFVKQEWQDVNAKLNQLLQEREQQLKETYLQIFEKAAKALKEANDQRASRMNYSLPFDRVPRHFTSPFDIAWDRLAAELDRAALIQNALDAQLKDSSKSDAFAQKITEINGILEMQLKGFCGEEDIPLLDSKPCLSPLQEGDETAKSAWKTLDVTLQKTAKALSKFEFSLSPFSSSSSESTPIKFMQRATRSIRALNFEELKSDE